MSLPPPFAAAIEGKNWDFIVRSPGRINIIGEHTDYNGGLVLPAAIDKAIYFAVKKRDDHQLVLRALDLDEAATVELPQSEKTSQRWVNYLLGITDQFSQRGKEVPGMEIVFGSDLPVGAGVSSSAALEGGMAFICNEVTASQFDRPSLARMCQASSNEFMGIPTGIMDQFASLNGKDKHAILLDCDTLVHEYVPADLGDHCFLLVNSRVTHELGSSEYPVRVAECQRALKALRHHYPSLEALGKAKLDQLTSVKPDLSPVVYRRAKYVIEEMDRVQSAVTALRSGDMKALGMAMNATHAGLRDDYEVSCAEIDFLQTYAEQYSGVLGSRIMGGGFGGCTINLIPKALVADFTAAIDSAYTAAYDIKPAVYEVPPSKGTEIIG